MKVVQQVYITRPDAFLDQSNSDMGLNLFGDKLYKPDEWVHVGEVTLNLDVDVADLTKTVIATLKNEVQKEIAESASRQFSLNRRIDELLALPAPGYDPTVHSYEGTCELCEGVCHEPDPADKWEKPEESQDDIHRRESEPGRR